jgi:hypothetical protein
MTGLSLQIIKAQNNLTEYTRQHYKNAAAQVQRGFIEFAQELNDENLHIRMSDAVKRSSWRRQFKIHDKIQKHLMTGTEAAENNVKKREQAANRERYLQALLPLSTDSTPISRPPPASPPQMVPNTPSNEASAGEGGTDAPIRTFSLNSSSDKEKEEREEEERIVKEALIPCAGS